MMNAKKTRLNLKKNLTDDFAQYSRHFSRSIRSKSLFSQPLCSSKAKFVVFLLAFLCLEAASAAANQKKSSGQNKTADYVFSVEPILSLKGGSLGEYVFVSGDDGEKHKLSYLDWQYKNVLLGGFNMQVKLKRIVLESHLATDIRSATGTMEDSDWLNKEITGTDDDRYGIKTGFSSHDNFLEECRELSAKAGVSFSPLPFLTVIPFAALEYESLKFSAKDGTGWYGNYSQGAYAEYADAENRTVLSYSGTVISYRRKTYAFWAGSAFKMRLPAGFCLLSELKIAPRIYTRNEDSHFITTSSDGTNYSATKNKNLYVDKCKDCFAGASATLGLEKEITPRFSLKLTGTFLYIKTIRGTTYEKTAASTSFKKSTSSEGGSSEKSATISFSALYKIY